MADWQYSYSQFSLAASSLRAGGADELLSSWLLAEGTIQHALQEPDGSRVRLDMVVTDYIRYRSDPTYMIVHEPLLSSIRMAVYSEPLAELRAGQTVDIEGTIVTLRTGRRVILCERIGFYMNELGLVERIPPVKGFYDPADWPERFWIETASSSPESSAAGIVRTAPIGVVVPLDDPILPPDAEDEPPLAGSPPTGSIAWAKTLPDNSPLTSTLEGKTVTAGHGHFDGFIYVEEPAHACGIKVLTDAVYVIGDQVNITSGTLGTDGCEREIRNATIVRAGSAPVSPMGISGRDIGGGPLGLQTGISDVVLGLNNIGLFARIVGRIRSTEPMRIADGWADTEALGQDQVRVLTDDLAAGNSIALPAATGTFVDVTGIASCTTVEGKIVRAIRPRCQEDVRPYLRITSPQNGMTITKRPSPVGIDVSGTLDPGPEGTVNDRVRVRVDSGDWYTGNMGQGVWTCADLPISGPSPPNWADHTITAELRRDNSTICSHSVSVHVTEKPVIHVKPSGSDSNSGLSWEYAKLTVQGGIDQSQAGYDVWVAEGTYQECITLKSGVGLYGGFAGTETYREQRKWWANITVLDGGAAGSVVTSPEGVDSATVIDGFTIRNGLAPEGAGVYCSSSSPTISHNSIVDNQALGLDVAYGGGIYCTGAAAPVILGNVIARNSVQAGGGRYGGGVYSTASSPTLLNNTIVQNSAVSDGGGIYLYSGSAVLTNNIVASNSGGGVAKETGATPTLARNLVFGNSADSKYEYSWTPTYPPGDLEPLDPCLAGDSIHVQPASPCVNAGDDTPIQGGWLDIDGQPRVQGAHVDIGADELHCGYTLSLEADPPSLAEGGTSVIVATVRDAVTGVVVPGVRVDFLVTDGALVRIYNDGASGSVDDPPMTGWGTTGTDGKVCAEVTRPTPGLVLVAAEGDDPCRSEPATETARAWFYDPDSVYDWPTFQHDIAHTGVTACPLPMC